jgi:hypothetical protein
VEEEPYLLESPHRPLRSADELVRIGSGSRDSRLLGCWLLRRLHRGRVLKAEFAPPLPTGSPWPTEANNEASDGFRSDAVKLMGERLQRRLLEELAKVTATGERVIGITLRSAYGHKQVRTPGQSSAMPPKHKTQTAVYP